jgi:CRISPR system Cascade subunit CasD
MSESTRAFAILLDAPMQSWGASSRFNRRETEAFPTKSALLGLLAAAAGIDKHDLHEAEKLAPFAGLRLAVYRLPRVSGRIVQRLSDFHTVGGGYDAKASSFERMSIPRKANGGPSANAVITHRTYLTEARFIAAFEGTPSIVAQAAAHLKDPVWGVWFGRKTCLPAMPLHPVEGIDSHSAVRALLAHLVAWEQTTGRTGLPPDIDPCGLERWEEPVASDLQAGDFHLLDQPVSFARREFHARAVRHHRP